MWHKGVEVIEHIIQLDENFIFKMRTLTIKKSSLKLRQFHPKFDDFSCMILRESDMNFGKSMLQISNLQILGAPGFLSVLNSFMVSKIRLKHCQIQILEAQFRRFSRKTHRLMEIVEYLDNTTIKTNIFFCQKHQKQPPNQKVMPSVSPLFFGVKITTFLKS